MVWIGSICVCLLTFEQNSELCIQKCPKDFFWNGYFCIPFHSYLYFEATAQFVSEGNEDEQIGTVKNEIASKIANQLGGLYEVYVDLIIITNVTVQSNSSVIVSGHIRGYSEQDLREIKRQLLSISNSSENYLIFEDVWLESDLLIRQK